MGVGVGGGVVLFKIFHSFLRITNVGDSYTFSTKGLELMNNCSVCMLFLLHRKETVYVM